MKWRIRTASMFVVMTGILMLVGYLIGFIFNEVFIGLLAMLMLSVVFSLYSYYFSKRNALRANKVRLVTKEEEPRLYALIEDLTQKADLPMPEVGVVETSMPNAFATGRNPKDAAVVATRGLMNMLTDDELEGVLSHELSHVKNRDILVMSVASTLAAVLSYLSRYAIYAVIFGGHGNDNGQQKAIAYGIAIVLSITVPIAALMVQLGVSRNREYLADESGAKMCGKPLALASALGKIEGGCASPKNEYDDNSYADLWISDPVRSKKNIFTGLFRTHPPTEDRIRKLRELAVKMGQTPGNGNSGRSNVMPKGGNTSEDSRLSIRR